jgi:Interferon-induced transmembrane protein/zinc-ribbon domain
LYCPNCGAQNSEDATYCANCGAELRKVETPGMDVPPPPQPGPQTSYAPQSAQASVPNYLVQAILTTVFCCLPLGIVSIVYAAQVNSKLQVGDRAGALESSRNARMWAWISFGSGLVLIGLPIVGYLILIVVGLIAQS